MKKQDRARFNATLNYGTVSNIEIVFGATTRTSGSRTVQDLKRQNRDCFHVIFSDTEPFRFRTATDEVFWAKKDHIALIEAGTPFDFEGFGGESAALLIPADLLMGFTGGRKPVSSSVAASQGMSSVLLDALSRLTEDWDAFAGEASEDVESFLASSVARAFMGPAIDDAFRKNRHLLDRAKRFIRANISDPDLNTKSVANHLSISVRSLHLVFQSSNEGCAACIRRIRLEHVYNELRRAKGDVSVSQIAYAFGFTNMSHFSKMFRERYGARPSLIRNNGASN